MLNINLRKIVLIVGLFFPLSVLAAGDSSAIKPQTFNTQKYISYVNTKDCVTLTSSPYVMVTGSGGANMNLTCPANRPVMYNWKQKVVFVGVPMTGGPSGGGDSKVTCCAVAYKWVS